MSRSYKKTPVVKDHESGKWGKNQANRKVRRCKNVIANGKAYRKVYNPWDIHDCVIRCTYEQMRLSLKTHETRVAQGIERPDPYDYENRWYKYYYRK